MKKNEFTFYLLISLIATSCSTKNDNIVEEYYPGGYIKTIMEVKDGKRNGLTKNFDEKGRLESTAELKDDKYEGWLTNYNTANGKVAAKAFYVNDTQNGPASLYYATGELYREMTYVDGRVDSIVKTYWANGKLQAEVYFRKGNPAIGLKEYDKSGKPVKQPTIVVEEINQLSLLNTVTLKIYLSDRNPKVDLYSGELIDGKYLDPEIFKYNDKNGVVSIQYEVPKRQTRMENISIIARTRTKYGNTLVLYRNYKFVASN